MFIKRIMSSERVFLLFNEKEIDRGDLMIEPERLSLSRNKGKKINTVSLPSGGESRDV